VLDSGAITYDVAGIKKMFAEVNKEFDDDSEISKTVRNTFSPQFEQWLCAEI